MLAAYLRRLADRLDTDGGRAMDMAEVLAARGYPASTGGSGARSSDTTSSTERAALQAAPKDRGEPWRPGDWENADRRLAAGLRALQTAALDVEAGLDTVLAHGSTADKVPAGTGYCDCGADCGPDRKTPTFCSPRQNGDSDRLKSGLAPNCYRRYVRWKDAQPEGNDRSVVAWKHVDRRAREVRDEKARLLAAGRAGLRG
jgi:hypothetical protein